MLANKMRLLDSIAFEEIDSTPVWLMRQAGRYLPEYRELRESAGSFLQLCKTPELATIVTLQPLKRFDLDAAILFSDILVIPDAMGMGLKFVENEGPQFDRPVNQATDIDNLHIEGLLSRLDYVFETIKMVRQELDPKIPLIGFSGSPFTLFCYMVEGRSSRNYFKTKEWLYNNREASYKLLQILADAVLGYLRAQIKAGCNCVMLFDSWGGILSDQSYTEFSLKYIDYIVRGLKADVQTCHVPIIAFTRGSGGFLAQMKSLKCDMVGLDWTTNIAYAKEVFANTKALQGNLDPILFATGSRAEIKKAVENILLQYRRANDGKITGHVFNLGHGIVPETPLDNVSFLVDLIRNFNES